MKSVMELFRELREDHDYSQSDIAAVLGISLSEHGREAVVEYIELQRLKERQKK